MTPLADDRRSWWPEGSVAIEEADEGIILECPVCHYEFLPTFLDSPENLT